MIVLDYKTSWYADGSNKQYNECMCVYSNGDVYVAIQWAFDKKMKVNIKEMMSWERLFWSMMQSGSMGMFLFA